MCIDWNMDRPLTGNVRGLGVVTIFVPLYSVAVIMYFCRPTQKHHPVFLDKEPIRVFPLAFGLLQKIGFMANKRLLHILFSKIIFTMKTYKVQTQITRSKKQKSNNINKLQNSYMTSAWCIMSLTGSLSFTHWLATIFFKTHKSLKKSQVAYY